MASIVAPRLFDSFYELHLAILAVVVISLQTKYGTLKINADESVAIAIENQSVQIRDKERQRVYTLTVGESRMKPGEYEIVVHDETAGLKFTTREFTITRNEATIIDASSSHGLWRFLTASPTILTRRLF